MKKDNMVETFYANIYCGLREGYGGKVHTIHEVIRICREYCDKVKLGVTVTPTNFVYVDGDEPGAIVGLINYPRFPSNDWDIQTHAYTLTKILIKKFKQERMTIVFPNVTEMIEKGDK